MSKIEIECGLCSELLFSFRLGMPEEEGANLRADVLGVSIALLPVMSPPGRRIVVGKINIFGLITDHVLSPEVATLPIVLLDKGAVLCDFEIGLDWSSLQCKIDEEASWNEDAPSDYFLGQDNLPTFILDAQREAAEGYFELALVVLNFVLERFPNHRIALINQESIESLRFVENVATGSIIRRDTKKSEKLSIGVCLFDRPREGRQVLSNLLYQSNFLDEHLEIIIGDNGDNRSYIADILDIFPQVIYEKRPCNIGVDQNMFMTYIKSTGEFIYIIGDDDLLFAGSLQKIIDAIDLPGSNGTSLIYFVPHIVDPDLRSLARGNYGYTLSPNEDHTILPRDAVVRAVGVGFLRLSSLVYRKHVHVDSAMQYLVGYYLFPLATALSALNFGVCCAINTPLYAYRQQTTSTWAPKAHQIFHEWQPRLFYAMGKAGDLGSDAVASVFSHLDIDLAGWRGKNDPEYIIDRSKSYQASESIIYLLREGILKNKNSIDLIAMSRLFGIYTQNLAAPSCFKIDEEGMMLHPREYTMPRSSCSFNNVPISKGSCLEIVASLPSSSLGTVTYKAEVCCNSEKGKTQICMSSFELKPGARHRMLADLDMPAGLYDVIVTTYMTEVGQSCEYAWARFERLVILAPE